ncbi:MAG: transcription elongation factor GreA [Deltaproteobacteria bacterium]|nr:transcription elongation factor GreA [Deltaproteobacteria bacterium]
MERVPFTREGLERAKAELVRLERKERPANIRAIEEARSHGDISENAEYHAAKERQSFIASKINELIRSIIGKSEVIDVEDGPVDNVVFGRTVLLYDHQTDDEKQYQLVGPYESDPEKGKISIASPLGHALIGKEVGDEIEVKAPAGIQEFEILEIT